jgi:site-specific recombinase XerD
MAKGNRSRQAGTIDWKSALMKWDGAYAANTIRAYRADFIKFQAWCDQEGHGSLPAAPETLALYVETLANEKTAPATIQRAVVGIGRIHRLIAAANPAPSDVVSLALKRMSRARGRRQKQAAGLTAVLRDRLLAACGADLRGLRDRALLSFGYDTLCRRSELVALQAEDIEILPDGDGSILIRRSKTDQAGEGRLGYLSKESVGLIRRWMDAAEIRSGPLFRGVLGLTVEERRLHPYAVNRILKALAMKAGLDPTTVKQLSGHSMRVGAAVDMVENGIDLVPIMHAGGWKSANMVLRYTQQISLAKSGMARLHAMRSLRDLRRSA